MNLVSRKAELSTRWMDLSGPDATCVAAEIAALIISELPSHLPDDVILRDDITTEKVLRALTNTRPFWNRAIQPESLYIPINELVWYHSGTETLLAGYLDVFNIPSSIHPVSVGDTILVNGYGEGRLTKLHVDGDDIDFTVPGLNSDDLTRIVGKKQQ